MIRGVLGIIVSMMLLIPSYSVAHRVNVFAWRNGQTINVQAGFSKSNPARQSKITVMDGVNKIVLLTGTTDDLGAFSFPLPNRASQNGLIIRVNAGEGHQNEWRLTAQECGLSETTKPASKPNLNSGSSSPKPQTVKSISPEDLRDIVDESVNHALEHKLAPIREAIAKQHEDGPRLIDIIGGLGWVVGIIGIGMAIQSRKK